MFCNHYENQSVVSHDILHVILHFHNGSTTGANAFQNVQQKQTQYNIVPTLPTCALTIILPGNTALLLNIFQD